MITHTETMTGTAVLSIDIGCEHYALCLARLPQLRVDCLVRWRLGDPRASPASQLIDRLLDHFQQWEALSHLAPDVVLIEQQMRGAHVNLALAFATYAHLKTRLPKARVRFVKPSDKFAAYRAFVDGVATREVPTAYAKRKRFAVQLAQDVLRAKGLPPLEALCPEAGAKKDDVADAFLQCFCANVVAD